MNRPAIVPLTIPVMGLPVRFQAGAPALVDAVEQAYGGWRRLDDALRSARPTGRPVPRIRLTLGPARPAAEVDGGVVIRTRPEGRLLFVDPGRVAGRASLAGMRADIRFATPALDEVRSVHEALDTLTLFLLTRLDRQPVHAAAIASAGAALVLAGPSGVGKSTLAYAALRAGLRVLTDDAVYVQLEPALRVWGMGRPLHLGTDAADWFPELVGRGMVRRANGTRKVPVALDRDGGAGEPPVVERAGLCILHRERDAPAVERVAASEAAEMLTSGMEPGFDVFRDSIPARLGALAAGGAWRVRVGGSPEAALATLVQLLARVGG